MLELLAKLRSVKGRKNKQIRQQGFIPAILYGHKVKNLPLLVEAHAFAKLYQKAGESTLIRLKIDDGQSKKERVVLIHEVAKDPVSDQIIHIDFNQVRMDEVITVEVPLVFVGQSEAVKAYGGVLIKNLQSVEIEALPQDLIHEIEVDISQLKTLDDNIYIKDLKVPEKVKLIAEPEEVVASVVPPRTQAELEELEEAPAEAVEEVEVEEKAKVKEEAEEKAEEKPKEKKEE
jgi:large subunit ribosomal protein L25